MVRNTTEHLGEVVLVRLTCDGRLAHAAGAQNNDLVVSHVSMPQGSRMDGSESVEIWSGTENLGVRARRGCANGFIRKMEEEKKKEKSKNGYQTLWGEKEMLPDL